MNNNHQPQADPAAVEETFREVVKTKNNAIEDAEERIPDWIDAEIQPPAVGQDCAFVVVSVDDLENGRVLGGRYQGYYEFTVPGGAWAGRWWYPLLPAPEIENNTLNSK